MSTSAAADLSPLDKPLHLLTEDDISQLTREDCRRYLKLKGMRRPSWNKSQAIQQVISLKALLEPAPEAAERDLEVNKPRVPPLNAADRVDVWPSAIAAEKRGTSEFQKSVFVEETAAPVLRREDYVRSYGDQSASGAAAGSPRVSKDTSLQSKQLTIFYSGKVNVYDDVSRDKAQSLLQLTATPLNCLLDPSWDETSVPHPHVNHPKTLTVQAGPNYLTPNLQPSQTVKVLGSCQRQKEESSINREDNQVEGASSRKASVQRYLEKRKDRFKRKVGMPFSLVAYSNQKIVDNVQDEHSVLPHFSAKYSPSRNTIGDLNLSANNTDTDEL